MVRKPGGSKLTELFAQREASRRDGTVMFALPIRATWRRPTTKP